MRRRTKVALICLGGTACLAVVGYVALIAALKMALSGTWPFSPLNRIENEIPLANGGVVQIVAVEQREFRSDGWTVHAGYRPQGSDSVEMIGEWEGYNHNPKIYIVGKLVILPSPDQKTLYVRTAQGKWKFFFLEFPDAQSSLPLSHYTTLSTLSEEELLSIREALDPDERGWSPSVSLDGFDPDTCEAHVLYRTNLNTVRHIFLKLSPDGTDLTLATLWKDKQPTTPPTVPSPAPGAGEGTVKVSVRPTRGKIICLRERFHS